MHIDFEEISIKNFMSYGAKPVKLNLREHPLTLIVGANGKGKSSLVCDSIITALFGRPSKSVKIKTIVNDINRKNCVIDLKFTINKKHSYRIVRGFSPDYVELYKDGEVEDSRSSKKFMQKEIDDITQLNLDTFKNICVLTANLSTSFLDMKAADARTVIENLFGLNIYSSMLKKIKEDRALSNDKVKIIERDIQFYTEVIDDYKKNVQKMKELKENFEKEKEEKLTNLRILKKNKEEEISIIKSEIAALSYLSEDKETISSNLSNFKQTKSDIVAELKVIKSKIKEENEKIALFENNAICPTCSSDLTGEHKVKELLAINQRITEYTNKQTLKDSRLLSLEGAIKGAEEQLQKISTRETELNNFKIKLSKIESDIKTITNNIEQTDSDNMSKHIASIIDVEKIKEYVEKYKTVKNDLIILKEEIIYQDIQKDILSDDGAKSIAIKRDLPYLNTKVNEYLRKLGFHINIEFNEVFGLVINNPRKANFDYNNFSNGQKKRIDLAILLAFMDLAKKKNSISTNIFVLDELLDSSLDSDGVQDFIDILNQKVKENNMNVFIISHKKDLVLENCRKIEVEQDGEFSFLKVS